jgi:hypothetical protein
VFLVFNFLFKFSSNESIFSALIRVLLNVDASTEGAAATEQPVVVHWF